MNGLLCLGGGILGGIVLRDNWLDGMVWIRLLCVCLMDDCCFIMIVFMYVFEWDEIREDIDF